jgi:DNA-binding LytR/AlgR family response regulator
MKVLIIEDEKLAEKYLKDLLSKTDYEIEVVASCDSVKNSIKWFIKNPEPDLVFMDIELGDGLCFEIFEVVDVSCPIIFTTAFDAYAIKAFKVNSIDYLLKPLNAAELTYALNKFSHRNQDQIQKNIDIQNARRMLSKGYKERFIIKIGEHLKTIQVKDILYFLSRDKATFATTKDGRNYLIDYTIDYLDDILDPTKYFRINRKYIIQYNAILDIITYSNSRLKVVLESSEEKDIIVARDRVHAFKNWLDK